MAEMTGLLGPFLFLMIPVSVLLHPVPIAVPPSVPLPLPISHIGHSCHGRVTSIVLHDYAPDMSGFPLEQITTTTTTTQQHNNTTTTTMRTMMMMMMLLSLLLSMMVMTTERSTSSSRRRKAWMPPLQYYCTVYPELRCCVCALYALCGASHRLR